MNRYYFEFVNDTRQLMLIVKGKDLKEARLKVEDKFFNDVDLKTFKCNLSNGFRLVCIDYDV